MDLKKLLGKLDLLEGTMKSATKNPTGPKFTGQWKGTDAGLPGKKYVGDSIEPEESILKDLSKGPSPKTREQELAEQFEQFLQALEEDNLGVEEKRPARKGSRPGRDYGKTGEPSKRYTYNSEDINEEQGRHYVIAHRRTDGRSAIVKKDGVEEYHPTKDAALARANALNARSSSPHVYYTYGGNDIGESRGHKTISTKLKNIEAQNKSWAVSDEEHAKHVERMKASQKEYLKKNPKSIYKPVDEAGANNPPQPTTPTTGSTTNAPNQAQQAVAVAQGTQALKSAIGSTAPTDVLAKAIDTASQGTAIDAKSAQALEPVMNVVKQAAQDPNLANQFKSIVSQAKTSAAKQTTQPKV